jgi:hypothetical protein
MKNETEIASKTVALSFPVFSLLGAVLVILKALGKITLAWKWVLAPFWLPLVVGLGVLGVILVIIAIAAFVVALLVD